MTVVKKAFIFLSILIAASSMQAQTITLGTITKLSYCAGDSMSVPYMASGTFAADNFFFVELSDANGSFSSFTSFGHSTSVSDTIRVALGVTGLHYRVRVTSTDPYAISEINPDDVAVTPLPSPVPYSILLPTPQQIVRYIGGLVGDPVILKDYTVEPSGSTYEWTFNEDAVPNTSTSASPTVTYPTDGTKDGILTVTNAAGCSASASFSFHVLSCNPIIPANAHIVTATEVGDDSVVWVKAGGSYTTNAEFNDQTVFAESGAIVTAGSDRFETFYLKSGSSFTSTAETANAMALLNAGNKINFSYESIDTTSCPDLQFDYSQVESVAEQVPTPAMSFRQLGDEIFASADGLPITIRILNLLGMEIQSQQGSGSVDMDLSSLSTGIYFAVVQSGGQQMVKKIAVTH